MTMLVAPATMRPQLSFLLVLLALLCSHIASLSVNHESSQKTSFVTPFEQVSRRRAFCSVATAAASLVASSPAQAVQERNEVLCKTGFFTNIGQWYCTDIGNIGDEGKSSDLSKTQDETADSLMSKLGISDTTTTDDSSEKEGGGKIDSDATR